MGDDREDKRLPYTYLAGIVSRGPRVCGTKGFPAVYTVIVFFVVCFLQLFFTFQFK